MAIQAMPQHPQFTILTWGFFEASELKTLPELFVEPPTLLCHVPFLFAPLGGKVKKRPRQGKSHLAREKAQVGKCMRQKLTLVQKRAEMELLEIHCAII